jgi:CheY-like chemotaxis protein
MTSDPIILILEDERSQILNLRAQLSGLGQLAEFMEPERALEYARIHRCDAAIVDVGMPRSRMDGIEFLRALREFDRDLAIIIRTGSESDQIADGAIEMRAIKRAVKSKTTLAELRASTRAAVDETRARREVARAGRDAEETRVKLVEALGTYDLRLAAADMHRGLVQALRNQLTALSTLATVLKEDAGRGGDRAFIEHACQSHSLVGAMVNSVNTFLDSPFGDHSAGSRASVNLCFDALRQFFRGAERWGAEGKRLVLRGLLGDTLVDCAPLELLNGLRHVAEYGLLHAAAVGDTSLSATILNSAGQMAERLAQAAYVLNRDAIRVERPYVVFRVAGFGEQLAPEEVRDAFNFGPQSGRTGNLNVLSQVLAVARGAVLIQRTASGSLTLEILLAVAL